MKNPNYFYYNLLVTLGIFSLTLLTGHLVKAETKTIQSEQVKAELSYRQNSILDGAKDINLKIFRKGKMLLAQPLNLHALLSSDESSFLKVVDLDKDQEPEIIINEFSGGAHCCFSSLIYHYQFETNTYSSIGHSWSHTGYHLNDKDGISEFESFNNQFAYEFSSFAGSHLPVQIWRYDKGQMIDVTRQYPKQVKDDISRMWQYFSGTEPKGFLAGYLGNRYLLDQEKDGWQLVQMYEKNDRQTYFVELHNYLRDSGYIKTGKLGTQSNSEIEKESKRFASLNLVNRGEELANLGRFKQAINSYKEAKKLNPQINVDVSSWETICKIDNIWEYAADVLPACDQLVTLNPKAPLPRFYRGLAHAIINNIDGAIDDFEKSIELIQASTKSDQTQLLLKQLYLISSLRQGRNTVVANAFLVKGAKLAQKGEIEKAITAYKEAEKSDIELQISAEYWNRICWNGSLHNQAAKVIDICEKAVALEPENPGIKDSRGLARGLTDNNKGAIEDFQAYINWIDANISKSTEDNVKQKLELQKRQRQYWMKMLSTNKNPFTPEEIKILLSENLMNES